MVWRGLLVTVMTAWLFSAKLLLCKPSFLTLPSWLSSPRRGVTGPDNDSLIHSWKVFAAFKGCLGLHRYLTYSGPSAIWDRASVPQTVEVLKKISISFLWFLCYFCVFLVFKNTFNFFPRHLKILTQMKSKARPAVIFSTWEAEGQEEQIQSQQRLTIISSRPA